MKDVLLQLLLGSGTALIGYIIGFRKNNVDLCGARLDELEKSIGVYNTIIGDLSNKVQSLKEEIKKLESRIEELIKENNHLKNKNTL